MKRMEIQGRVWCSRFHDDGSPHWTLEYEHGLDMTDQGWIGGMPGALIFEVPDDWDPSAAHVEKLKAEREAIRAEYARKVRRIDDRISKLQALPFEVVGGEA